MRLHKKPPVRRTCAIVVDGECEFWYIQMLKRNERHIRIDLKPEIPQKKKLSDQYARVRELSEDYDRVFWIIDLDVVISESRTAKKGTETPLRQLEKYIASLSANKKNVEVIINNPCLEFWFLLHFQATTKSFSSCDATLKPLCKCLSGYEKTQKYFTRHNDDIYLKLKPNLASAETNANKREEFKIIEPNAACSQMPSLFYYLELLPTKKK